MFEWLLGGVILILTSALVVVSKNLQRYRRNRRAEGRGRPWNLPRRPVDEIDPVFIPHPNLGHTHSTEVAFIGGSSKAVGITSDYEAWILATLAKRATTMFEFGTATGRTAYLWARNSPPDARVYTLTLDKNHEREYCAAPGDDDRDERDALTETSSEQFLYSGTDVEHKVVQLYGDSKIFDDREFSQRCDVVFVDGSHARSYVKSDSEKALRMVKPGGLVLWHDYRGPRRSSGVFHTLNELHERISLIQIEGTSLVAHRVARLPVDPKPHA